MSSEELASALAPWGPAEEGDLFGRDRGKKSRTRDKENEDEGDRPLFPPSPPGSPGGRKEHPLKILARVGWMLWRHQLEDDEEEDEGEGDAIIDEPSHIQVSRLFASPRDDRVRIQVVRVGRSLLVKCGGEVDAS